MTLDVENCHSIVHINYVNMSMIEYARSFKLNMKESFKRVTQWAAFYHTSRKSWYPKPKEAIPFSKVPLIKPLPIVDMSKANCDIMRNWASAYGAAVRQRTVRQETTMTKHGKLPEFICQSQLLFNQWMKADHPLLYKMKHNQSTSSLTTLIDMINLAATVLVTTMTNRIPFSMK